MLLNQNSSCFTGRFFSFLPEGEGKDGAARKAARTRLGPADCKQTKPINADSSELRNNSNNSNMFHGKEGTGPTRARQVKEGCGMVRCAVCSSMAFGSTMLGGPH